MCIVLLYPNCHSEYNECVWCGLWGGPHLNQET